MSTQGLDEAALLPFLRGSFGRPYLFEPTCISTQDLLRRSGLPEGAVAVTEHQTAGRGRSGHRWEDAVGASILASIMLRPATGRLDPALSLVCGLAVAEAIETATGLAAQLKWPNDVLVGGRKVAGILLEADGDAVVAGLGINVNQSQDDLPAGTKVQAGSLLLATGRAMERAPLLAEVLSSLERRYRGWRKSGLAPLLPAYETRNWLRGRRVVIDGWTAGTALSIDASGRQQVRLDDGSTVPLEAGEISLAE